jgi:hypothetical protein
MQDQLCVRIDIGEMEDEGELRAQRVRNRRYKKMIQLRESGFFSEEAIKLRHVPLARYSHSFTTSTLASTRNGTLLPFPLKLPFRSSSRRTCSILNTGRV